MSGTKRLQIPLSRAQAERFVQYCAMYRRSLVQFQAPSTRRNQAMRAAQAVQGRLGGWTACKVQEEMETLQQVVIGLLRQQRTTHPGTERSALIAALADTFVLLHRGGAPTGSQVS